MATRSAKRGFLMGTDWARLFSAFMMLAIIVMLIRATRNATMWRFFTNETAAAPREDWLEAGDSEALSQPEEPSSTATARPVDSSGAKSATDKSTSNSAGDSVPATTETALPADETSNYDANAELADLLNLVTDRTLQMHWRELPAYWRLVDKARNDSFDEVIGTATSGGPLKDYFLNPKNHRGDLVRMEFNIRRIGAYEVANTPLKDLPKLYELWGTTDESSPWLFALVVPELPPGIKEGKEVDVRVRFVGRFFKLQAYYAAISKPNERPLLAPLFIGNVQRLSPVAPPKMEMEWKDLIAPISVAVVGIIVVISLVRFLMPRRKVGNHLSETTRDPAEVRSFLAKTESEEGKEEPVVREDHSDMAGSN